MPVMTRIKGKATNIAFKILGTPPNMRKNKIKTGKKKKEQLNFEEHFVPGR
jgi:hypothetical protein